MLSMTALHRSRPLVVALFAVLTLGLAATLASPVAVQAQEPQELGTIADSLHAIAGEVEQSAGDLEEIYDDMRTVAFSLRLMSFAPVGIPAALQLNLAAPLLQRS